MSAASTTHDGANASGHDHDDAHDHHDPPFWRKYIFSTDHKIIGIQYGFTALLSFWRFGFFLMMVMRWSIAYPDRRGSRFSRSWPWFQAWLDAMKGE